MEILALLPLVWLLVWLMGKGKPKTEKGKDRYVDITLSNMKDDQDGYDVVSAYKNLRNGKYGAKMWLPSIEKATYLSASSKEELEKIVEQTRKDLRDLN
ncbi:MAG: hypothetical protein IKX36_12115 [Prevotella sp.]|nr:hypothetical protein [Prevotella sp.]